MGLWGRSGLELGTVIGVDSATIAVPRGQRRRAYRPLSQLQQGHTIKSDYGMRAWASESSKESHPIISLERSSTPRNSASPTGPSSHKCASHVSHNLALGVVVVGHVEFEVQYVSCVFITAMPDQQPINTPPHRPDRQPINTPHTDQTDQGAAFGVVKSAPALKPLPPMQPRRLTSSFFQMHKCSHT